MKQIIKAAIDRIYDFDSYVFRHRVRNYYDWAIYLYDEGHYIYESDARKALEDFGVYRAFDVVKSHHRYNAQLTASQLFDATFVANELFYIIGTELVRRLVDDLESDTQAREEFEEMLDAKDLTDDDKAQLARRQLINSLENHDSERLEVYLINRITRS